MLTAHMTGPEARLAAVRRSLDGSLTTIWRVPRGNNASSPRYYVGRFFEDDGPVDGIAVAAFYGGREVTEGAR